MTKSGVFTIVKIFLVVALLVILPLTFFETLGSTDCAKKIYDHPNPCVDLVEREYGRELTLEELDVMLDFAFSEDVENIDLSKINDVIDTKTKYISRNNMYGANGISCGLLNFVAVDLPPQAMNYVETHEALHTLGVKNETRANYTAAKIEPVGFIETIFYSIKVGITSVNINNISGVPCRVGRMWNAFKMYFLDIET